MGNDVDDDDDKVILMLVPSLSCDDDDDDACFSCFQIGFFLLSFIPPAWSIQTSVTRRQLHAFLPTPFLVHG